MKKIDVGQTITMLAVLGVLVGFILPKASSQTADDEVGIDEVVEAAEVNGRERARAERAARPLLARKQPLVTCLEPLELSCLPA